MEQSERTDGSEQGAALEYRRLAPNAWVVQMLASLIGTLVLAGFATIADFAWRGKPPWWPLPTGAAAAVFGGLLLLRALIYPFFWQRAWRYAIRAHDILACHGVFWKTKRSVPRRRIQHVDIQSGPIDRAFGLCSITLYTAGSGDEDAAIPGLRERDAEALRDELLRDASTIPPADAGDPLRSHV